MTTLTEKLDEIEQYYTQNSDKQGLLRTLERIAFEKRSPGSGTIITDTTVNFYASGEGASGKIASLDSISFLKAAKTRGEFEFIDEEMEACFAARFVARVHGTIRLPGSFKKFFESSSVVDILIKKCCDILVEKNKDKALKAKLHPQEPSAGCDWMWLFKKLDCCDIAGTIARKRGYNPIN